MLMSVSQNKSYKQYLAEMDDHIDYIGPRALFDPNFIPKKYLPREKIAYYIDGVMGDAINDGYATNINLYGLQGSGKNLAIHHYLQWVMESNKVELGGSSSCKIHILHVDCNKRDDGQVLFQLVSQLGPLIHPMFSARKALELNSLTLWNLFKILIEKANRPVILHLQHSEVLTNIFVSKLFLFSKSCRNLQIFTTIDSGMQRYHFKQYEAMDHKLQFETYSISDIFTITNDRVKMAIPHQISEESIKLMVDFVGEFDINVPGASIRLLKELYPTINQYKEIQPEHIRVISQYNFDGFSLDAYQMADFVVNSSVEDRLFLENVINYFQKQQTYYIFMQDVKKAYKMMCDELGFPVIQDELKENLKKIVDNNILCLSKYYQNQTMIKTSKSKNNAYFLTIPIQEASELMEASFKNYFDMDEDPFVPLRKNNSDGFDENSDNEEFE